MQSALVCSLGVWSEISSFRLPIQPGVESLYFSCFDGCTGDQLLRFYRCVVVLNVLRTKMPLFNDLIVLRLIVFGNSHAYSLYNWRFDKTSIFCLLVYWPMYPYHPPMLMLWRFCNCACVNVFVCVHVCTYVCLYGQKWPSMHPWRYSLVSGCFGLFQDPVRTHKWFRPLRGFGLRPEQDTVDTHCMSGPIRPPAGI